VSEANSGRGHAEQRAAGGEIDHDHDHDHDGDDGPRCGSSIIVVFANLTPVIFAD
jgi:hypothetical protein